MLINTGYPTKVPFPITTTFLDLEYELSSLK